MEHSIAPPIDSMKAEATSVGMLAREMLTEDTSTPFGSVHSVFPHAFNVLTLDDLLLVVNDSTRHPAAITLRPQETSFARLLRPGWSVQKKTYGFSVIEPSGRSALDVDIRNANTWDGGSTESSRQQLMREIRHLSTQELETTVRGFLSYVAVAFELWGQRNGLGSMISEVCGQPSKVHLNTMAEVMRPRIVKLYSSLQQDDKSEISDSIWSLLGMGAGLTPSGDDVLGGLVATWTLVDSVSGLSFKHLDSVRRYIAAYSQMRTATLSKYLLNYACRGMVCDRFYFLIRAFAQESGEVLERAKSALQWGGTSGEDTTLGICLAFRLALPQGTQTEKSFASD